MRLTTPSVAILVVALLSSAMAAAQRSPPAEQPVAAEGQLVGSAISLVQGGPPATLDVALASPRPRRFTWDATVSGKASGDEIFPKVAGNGQAWRVTTGVSYSTANVTFGLGLHGQHGYQLPSSMSFALGGVSASGFRHPGFVDATGSQVWDARLMMKRRLAASRRGASVEAVGEAFLPLGRDSTPPDVPGSYMPIRSRALRFGLLISY